MKILAIEGSAKVASVALLSDGCVIADFMTDYNTTHSQTLMMRVEEVLRATKVDKSELDAIAVAVGPGSFTGLRIASATAKGLADGLNIKLIPVSTLEAMSEGLTGLDFLVCPILDARRGQVYTALFGEDGKRHMEDCCIMVEELCDKLNSQKEPVVFLGDGIKAVGDVIKKRLNVKYIFLGEACRKPSGSKVANLAYRRFDELSKCGKDFKVAYIKATQAERERESKDGNK